MNYIYDIVVNFNTYAFDFYDWNIEDKITHIRKIPIYKVKTSILSQIIEYDVKFNPSFLETIKNQTEVFTNKSVKIVPYSCLLCDGINVIAIKIDKNHTYKSRLQLDEEEEVLDVCERINEQVISFEKKRRNSLDNFTTRKQMNIIKQINKMLYKTYTSKDYETLKYVYYECFNEKIDDVGYIMKKITTQIQNNNEILLNKIHEFYKLIEIKK